MNIGLYDVDSKNFPNLCLMKISSYHKKKGDNVEFINYFNKYDIVYKSKIFTFSKENNIKIQTDNIIFGGSGYENNNNKLSDEIEYSYPDYSLYSELTYNKAYGFLTRGCFRKCPFCIVSKKDGEKSIKVADLNFFWNGQKEIILMDSNLLACKDRIELLDQLINSNVYVDFNQGLDIRLINDEIIEKLKKIKIKRIHFAWDLEDNSFEEKFSFFKKKINLDYSLLAVYVLVNFNTSFEYDLYRVYKLKELGYNPYIMIYNVNNCNKKYKDLRGWVNARQIFRTVEKFEDYKKFEDKNNNNLNLFN